MRRPKKILIGLFMFVVITLCIIIYAIPGLTGALTRTDILQYGNLKITDEVTCYFVRNETVYSAARAGSINYYIGDGIRVKAGTKILDVAPSVSVVAEQDQESKYGELITRLGDGDVVLLECLSDFNGVTSYYVDGYETFFTPETMRSLKYEQVSNINPVPVNVTRNNTLKGEPLYKICKNEKWYMLCWVDAGDVSKYKIDGNVTINLPLGQIRGIVIDIIEDGNKWLVIFQTNWHYEDFARMRVSAATVVTSDYNGIIIRNESITTSEGAIGVYIKTKSGSYAFRPVKIITSDGHFSLVEVSSYYDSEGNKVNTVEIYDEILKNPNLD